MTEPKYKRAFDTKDFRGYFTWDKTLSSKLSVSLYHACHLKELKKIIDEKQLSLRSEWSLNHPQYGKISVPGVWCGLNDFSHNNHYGPFLIKLPISVLDGRTFMVFWRKDERERYFFVQYESKIPLFEYKSNIYRRVKPTSYFGEINKNYCRKGDSIYDLVLTYPLPIDDAKIDAVEHPECIPKKCNSSSRKKNRDELRKIAMAEAIQVLSHSEEFSILMKKYPCLSRVKLNLAEIDY